VTEVREIDELDRTGILLDLSSSERRMLLRARDQLGVEWRDDGKTRIYSKGNVGTITLSPQTTIRVTTKVPVANLLALASLAFETQAVPPSVGDAPIDSADPFVDILALLLVGELEALLRNGLRQDYVVVDDDLPYIRGRLRFEEAQSWSRPGLSPCEFADFVPDTTENRVLRCALELLMSRRLLPGLRRRVEWLLPSFRAVEVVRAGKRLLASCRLTRLNEHYVPSLELSRLLIENLGVEADPGLVSVPAYFFPLETIYEKALTNFIRRQFAQVYPQRKRTFTSVAGAPTGSLSFAADIVLGDPPVLVIDTKYAAPEVRNQYGGWSFRNDHIYQVSFYGLSLGCPAMLAYPRVNRDLDVTFQIEGLRVSVLTVNLQERGLSGLECFSEVVTARLAESRSH